MGEPNWKPTACNLCYANCGILAQVDESTHTITKVKGDRNHPASQGYTCNKAARISYYQNGRDRLTTPLRRRADGSFEAVDWDTAVREIAAGLRTIRETSGGSSILYYGGGGQGNHLGGTYALALRNALGIRFRSNALAQEKTGLAWMNGRMLGGTWHGDFHHCDVAIIVGKNPWQSNGIQQARVLMRDIGRDPGRTLIVLDPRKSETAELADIHLAVKPGTDVWVLTAILAWLVQNRAIDLAWLHEHTAGYERILVQLGSVDIKAYAAFGGITLAQIEQVGRAMAATRKIAVYEDLGVEMSPNSTLCSYLNILLFVLTGAFDVEGGTHLVNGLVSLLSDDRRHGSGDGSEDDANAGYDDAGPRTPVTGARIISGLVPCNVIPEEILTDHPQRFRAMIVESSNPLHSLADSKAFREAFTQLDMTLVIDVAMTETAALANWVLPASSTYEKAEATFFPMEFPDNFFHLRRPLLPPLPGTLPEAEIHARLVEALGVFDPGELKPLEDAAKKGLDAFAAVMLPAMMNPKISSHVPYVLYRTLGPTLPEGTDQAASLWGLTQMFAMNHADLVHAAGIEGEGPALGNNLFSAIVNGTSGVVISRTPIGHRSQWRRPDGKILLAIPEMNDELDSLKDFRLPARPRGFPLLLAAGQRRLYTANTIIRDPDWMKSNNPAALTIHPADATRLGFTESARARLITERGEAIVSLEFDDGLQEGTIALPNGLGLSYPDAGGNSQIHGVSLNELTSLKHRDPWVGTPLHKHVPARLERIA